MKKITLLIIFSTIYFFAVAQKNTRTQKVEKNPCANPVSARSAHRTTYTYSYDFKNPDKSSDCHVMPRHKKDVVYINLTNINTLLYDIDASGTITNLPLEKISLFDSLASSLKAGAIKTDTKTVESAPLAQTTKTMITKSGNKRIYKVVATPYFTEKQVIERKQKYINDNFKSWVSNMQKLEYFLNFGKNVPGLIEGECCDKIQLKTNLLTEGNVLQFAPYIYDPAAINLAVDYPKLISAVGSIPPSLIKDIKDELLRMKEAKQAADEKIEAIKKDCKDKKIRDSEKECDVDNLEDNYPDDFAKAVRDAEGIDVTKTIQAAEQLRNLLIKVSGEPFNYKMLNPFQIEGDNYEAKLRIKPKSQYASNVKSDSIVIPFLVKGKFEWAVGPAVNFHLSKSLFDQSFQIDSSRNAAGIAKTDTFNITKNANRNRLTPSIGVMAHFYWQRHTAFTPGFVVGLSTSVADIKDLRAYLGLSFMLGGLSDKVFINTGYAFGWSDRLKSNLIEGENLKSQIPYTGDKIASPEQLVEKSFHAGLFIGVTYKLSK